MHAGIKKIYRLYRPVWNWRWFSWVARANCCKLLSSADSFDTPVFVSGCQRSGTTLVARAIRQSSAVEDIGYSIDDELDAAYILNGKRKVSLSNRYCFQTTYLNECYREYLDLTHAFNLIWVIRNPYSVVYSMVYNWPRYPLNELFLSCGYAEALKAKKVRRKIYSTLNLSAIEKACYAYQGKINQILELYEKIDKSRLLIIDYEDLVLKKETMLPEIFKFIDIPYQSSYENIVHQQSVDKSKELSEHEKNTVRNLCDGPYRQAKQIAFKTKLLPTE